MSRIHEPFEMFAVAAPGLENIVARELSSLGFGDLKADVGGVTFQGALSDVSRANLHVRTASRLIVRLASFRATAFHELERGARRVPWEKVLVKGQATRLRVSCRKSRLYHSDAVAERVASAVERVTGVPVSGSVPDPDDDSPDEAGAPHPVGQLLIVRVNHDLVTISADSSGPLLHRRGYRLAVGKAPLRETLAAAMVLESGWTAASPLVDPFCGSGTILIEAALIARSVAPGLQRARAGDFAFVHWPAFDKSAWQAEIDAAEGAIRTGVRCELRGSDRDDGAIAAAQSNATRARVSDAIEFERHTISEVTPGPEEIAGWILTNPPYGVRVGDEARLRDLYDATATVLHQRFHGWKAGLLLPEGELERRLDLPFSSVFATRNGGIPVRFVQSRIEKKTRESAG